MKVFGIFFELTTKKKEIFAWKIGNFYRKLEKNCV